MAKRTYGKYQGKSPTEKLTDARQALFDALLADMELEGSLWVKEWSFPHPPMNGVTGKGYGPRNTAMLMYAMRDGGFRDPRFATFKMASDKGCHIIKGSHGYPIERWKRMLVSRTDPTARLKQPKTKEEWDIALANPEYKAEPRCVGTFTIFNAEQMENTENLVSVEGFKPIEPDLVADGIVKASPCPVIETPNDEAFYLPGADKIYVPQRNQFTNVESFCRTLLHEMGHATGHPSRLDREQCGLKQNRQKYAFEELIAELSSVFTANAIGLDLRHVDDDKPLASDEVDAMSNSAAYLKGWSKELKDPGGELLKAASRASKATDYLVEDCFTPVLGKDYFKSRDLNVELDAGLDAALDVELEVAVEVETDSEGFSLDELCASKCDEADIANGDERDDAVGACYEEGR